MERSPTNRKAAHARTVVSLAFAPNEAALLSRAADASQQPRTEFVRRSAIERAARLLGVPLPARESHQILGDVARRRRVQAALIAVGSSQKECADALGVSGATVSRVVSGLQNSEEVEAWIAARTGRPRDELFGEEGHTATAA